MNAPCIVLSRLSVSAIICSTEFQLQQNGQTRIENQAKGSQIRVSGLKLPTFMPKPCDIYGSLLQCPSGVEDI